MPDLVFTEVTIDDLMRSVVEAVLGSGGQISPGKGPAIELTGVLLELRDPRARLSRTETRGKAFSCLGELCWYLAGSDRLDLIQHYIPAYEDIAEDGVVYGAYGPRLFNWRGLNQVDNVITRLREHPNSRRAVIQLFDATDLPADQEEIPCTCTLQFLVRDGLLHLLVNMRSNDVVVGLPHDVFCFTMLQEMVARSLSADLGWYRHAVGSLHVYDADQAKARTFLDEGWQSTKLPMPPMPIEDPWPAVHELLEAESAIRDGRGMNPIRLAAMDPYWADLVRLLGVHASAKKGDAPAVERIRDDMANGLYRTFIDGRLEKLE